MNDYLGKPPVLIPTDSPRHSGWWIIPAAFAGVLLWGWALGAVM